jgi:predicted amidohydrolase
MKAGCLQYKPELGNPSGNIGRIAGLIKDKDFDLLVLPELANSGYLFSDTEELYKCSEEIPGGDFCRALKQICSEKNAYIVSGICERSGDKFYNSSILVYPSGEIKTYRKIHLFYEEKLWFAPGDIRLQVYEIEGRFGKVKIGMMICYDWLYPEIARALALKGAQLICHPSNLVMPYCQDAMFTRAFENHVFTITANRTGKDINKNKELSFTGKSVILSPKGEYLYKGPGDIEECVVIDINPEEALNKDLNRYNNLFKDRREEFYS